MSCKQKYEQCDINSSLLSKIKWKENSKKSVRQLQLLKFIHYRIPVVDVFSGWQRTNVGINKLVKSLKTTNICSTCIESIIFQNV